MPRPAWAVCGTSPVLCLRRILPEFLRKQSNPPLFRRIVTSNIKKLLQCAILLVLCLSAFLYYSACLSYLFLSDKFVRILICKDSFSRERLFRTICDTVSPAGITTLSFEYLAAVVVPLTVLLSPINNYVDRRSETDQYP